MNKFLSVIALANLMQFFDDIYYFWYFILFL